MTIKESDEARKEVSHIDLFCPYKIKHMAMYVYLLITLANKL